MHYIFRSHPSYRADTGQSDSKWYDWATFNVEEGKPPIPCQILCFLELGQLISPTGFVSGYPVDSPGLYAVVRRFRNSPVPSKKNNSNLTSRFVTMGSLAERLYLFSCDCIVSEVAVVPDFTKRCAVKKNYDVGKNWFVVSNRNYWLDWFHQKIYSTSEKISSN